MKTTYVVAGYVAAGFCFVLVVCQSASEQGFTSSTFGVLLLGCVLAILPQLRRGKIAGAEFETTFVEMQHQPVESPSLPSSSSSSSSSAVAQQYPYLPEFCGQSYISTFAQWQILRFTAAYNSERYLTDKLIQESISAEVFSTHLDIIVSTHPQPTSNLYRGEGQFDWPEHEVRTAYHEAGRAVMQQLRTYFPAISGQDVRIYFFIRGAPVGTWQGGNMTLAGEEPSSPPNASKGE